MFATDVVIHVITRFVLLLPYTRTTSTGDRTGRAGFVSLPAGATQGQFQAGQVSWGYSSQRHAGAYLP